MPFGIHGLAAELTYRSALLNDAHRVKGKVEHLVVGSHEPNALAFLFFLSFMGNDDYQLPLFIYSDSQLCDSKQRLNRIKEIH